jgi:uncharacterized membrane protein
MNGRPAPKWIRFTIATVGAATLLFSVLCFVAPERLFGVDAYRTLTGVPIGLLGAVTFGLAASALVAARRGNIHVMRSSAMNMFLAAALVPPVITYNIGAFDAISTSGVRALSLSVTFIAGISLPLLLTLLVLNRLTHDAV